MLNPPSRDARTKRWRGGAPTDREEARLRLVNAALLCCGRIGIERVTIGDVAQEAGVHRSTVYEYFANREVLLEALYFVEAERITQAVMQHSTPGRTFIENLVDSIVEGVKLTRASANLTYLMSAGVGVLSDWDGATGLDASIAILGRHMVEPLQHAVARGELRDDVPIDQLIGWIVRIAISLTAQPSQDVDQSLRWFLLPAVQPQPRSSSPLRRSRAVTAT